MDASHRFWIKVDFGDCWNWTAGLNRGYGRFRDEQGRQRAAHRWAWEHLVGPIPGDLTIDHLCRNTRCVNPDHMELVPGAVNVLRGYSPPSQHSRRSICAKGHPLQQGWGQRLCPVCKLEYQRKWSARKRRAAGVAEGRGAKWKAKTECVHGHAYTEENTGRTKKGFRFCKTCARLAKQRKRATGSRG